MIASTKVDDECALFPFTLGLVAVVVLGYLTYFRGYDHPSGFFWDENYHIASAQKYLNNVFFMEPHPPLGKLLIASGEWLTGANLRDDHFIGVDYAKDPPVHFSFAGYRLFPALFAWLVAPLLYVLFVEITRKALWATLFTVPYLFDNALIVHSRGAMLEGPQLFFVVLLLLFFVRLSVRRVSYSDIVGIGLALGAAVSVKVNALVLAPLPLVALVVQRPGILRGLAATTLSYLCSFSVFVTVWWIHIGLGTDVVQSLPNEGFYRASQEYREALLRDEPPPFITAVLDHVSFGRHYTSGVPRYDPCKPGETGSPPYVWPVGGGAINYRWEKNESGVRYLYLQANPIGWASAFSAILVVSALALTKFLSVRAPELPAVAWILTAAYWSYMVSVSVVDRVLYLYHYFIPLLLGYVVLPLALDAVERIGPLQLSPRRKLSGLLFVCSLIVGSHLFFRPLTNFEPLTSEQFRRRQLAALWRLVPVE